MLDVLDILIDSIGEGYRKFRFSIIFFINALEAIERK